MRKLIFILLVGLVLMGAGCDEEDIKKCEDAGGTPLYKKVCSKGCRYDFAECKYK